VCVAKVVDKSKIQSVSISISISKVQKAALPTGLLKPPSLTPPQPLHQPKTPPIYPTQRPHQQPTTLSTSSLPKDAHHHPLPPRPSALRVHQRSPRPTRPTPAALNKMHQRHLPRHLRSRSRRQPPRHPGQSRGQRSLPFSTIDGHFAQNREWLV
jgi:hypothetical protein